MYSHCIILLEFTVSCDLFCLFMLQWSAWMAFLSFNFNNLLNPYPDFLLLGCFSCLCWFLRWHTINNNKLYSLRPGVNLNEALHVHVLTSIALWLLALHLLCFIFSADSDLLLNTSSHVTLFSLRHFTLNILYSIKRLLLYNIPYLRHACQSQWS